MKRILLHLLFPLLLLLPAAGCSAGAPTAVPDAAISLVDGLGTTVDLAASPRRIVSLGPSNTEILFALGVQDRIVGCDQHSDHPDEAVALATIADYPVLNVESIVALEPDLVLASELFAAEQVQALRDLGLTVFWLGNPKELPDGLYENIRTVGQLTGAENEADRLAESLSRRVDAVRQKAEAADTAPLVYYELDGSDPARPWTAGSGSGGFVDILIRLAGGRNLGGDLPGAFASISLEEIIQRDPDLIIGDPDFGTTAELVAARPGWGELRAVKNGAIFPIDSDLTTRPGPRLVDGLETLFHLIHPELP